MDGIKSFIEMLKRDKSRRRKLAGVICVLAMFVVGGVFWRLRIIGLTKTADPLCGIPEHIHTEECIAERILICGYPDETDPQEPQEPVLPEPEPVQPLYSACLSAIHQHDASCFDLENNLICQKADFVIHTHDSFCFDESGALICPLNEVFEHTHGDECYADGLICGLSEGELVTLHTHTAECYDADGALICGLPESEPHTHSELCYGRTLICGLGEISAHMHSPECFDESGALICAKTEILVHQHSAFCRNIMENVGTVLQPEIGTNPTDPVVPTVPADPEIGGLQPVIGLGDELMGLNPELGIGGPEPISDNMDTAAVIAEPYALSSDETLSTLDTPDTLEVLGTVETPEVLDEAEETEETSGEMPETSDPADPVVDLPSDETAAPHVHTDECYMIVYKCGLEEHVHSISCYADITDGLSEAQEYLAMADGDELSGYPAADVYMIAATQLDYTESKRNFILDENNVRKGYNLYSAWYTGGDGAYADWNATFAAFCLSKAGIGREVIPYNSGVHAWTVDLENAGLMKHVLDGGPIDYGDIVFFDTDMDGIADRVGICATEKGIGDIFYTIEGDTSDTSDTYSQFAENGGLTAIDFSQYGELNGFAQAELLGGVSEEIPQELVEPEPVKASYIWDDDNIETHAVAEVERSYSAGNIVGYVDVSEISENGEPELDNDMAVMADESVDYDSKVQYKLYTGDFTDLAPDSSNVTGHENFVIRNVAADKAVGIDYNGTELRAATLTTSGNSVPYTTLWHFKDVDWSSEAFLVSTNIGNGNYIVCDENAETAIIAPESDWKSGINPNITILPNSDDTFRMRVTYVNGKTLYYVVNDDKLSISGNESDAASFKLIKDDGSVCNVDVNNIKSNVVDGKIAAGGNSELHGQDFYIATADGSKYLTLNVDKDGVYTLVLKSAVQKPATLTDIEQYEIWSFEVSADNKFYTLRSDSGYYLNLSKNADGNNNKDAINPVELSSNAGDGQAKFRNTDYGIGLHSVTWNRNFLTLDSNTIKSKNSWGAPDGSSISLYQNGKLVYPIFNNDGFGNNDEYAPPLTGKFAIVLNDNIAVALPEQGNIAPLDFDKTTGIVENSNIKWTFEKFEPVKATPWIPHQYRVKNDDSHWLPINGSNTYPMKTAIYSWGDGSKFDFIPIDGTNQCYIRRLDSNDNHPTEYLVYDSSTQTYKYESSGNPSDLGDRARFELYHQYAQREIVENKIFAHWYEVSGLTIVLKKGEEIKFTTDNAGYLGGTITSTNNAAEGKIYDSYYVKDEKVPQTRVVLSIEAKEVNYPGNVPTTVTFKAADGASYNMNVWVVDNDDDYKEALAQTYTERRYRHLDVEIDASFEIHVFRPDGSYYSVAPDAGSIKVESVTAKIFNTYRKTWTKEYIENPEWKDSSANVMYPTMTIPPLKKENGEDDIPYEMVAYVNPIPTVYSEYVDKGWSQFEERDYGCYKFDYNESDTFKDGSENGITAPSYAVTYFPGKTQNNGQYEFLTKGWGWLEFYDGDTAVLECEVSYEYGGKKYLTPMQTVVKEINQTNNICPAANGGGNIQGFDITVEVKDTELFESTVFEKVDQYGEIVPGAQFSFYRADTNYHYTQGDPICTETTDENGVFNFTYKDVWEYVTRKGNANDYNSILGDSIKKPTDSDFVDGPLTMYQLKKFLGDHFIMVEDSVPSGYRKLATPIKLCFIGNDNNDTQSQNLYLQCDNVVETGVMADPNAYVKAPGTLTKAYEEGTIAYFNNNGHTGELYAVILAKNGADAELRRKWSPVTGTDYDGYELHKPGENEYAGDVIKRLIASGKYDGKGIYKFTKDDFANEPTYSAMVKNMPGNITQYYQYLKNNNLNTSDSEYMIAYYYQENENAIPVMVKSNYGYDQGTFRINWSSTVKIPNNENRLFFQKLDYDGNLLNDTVFALYPATVKDGEKYYKSGNNLIHLEPADGFDQNKQPTGKATVYVNGDLNNGVEATYTINTMYWTGARAEPEDGYLHNPDKGVIYVKRNDNSSTYYLAPMKKDSTCNYVGYTHTGGEDCPIAEDGTGHFGRIPNNADGEYYILKEIAPPNGFSLNPNAETLIHVDDNGVFAHAGTQGDGVSVGNGPGFLLSTMKSYATRNSVNETLRWIYTALRVNDSLAFPAQDFKLWSYAKPSEIRKGWAYSDDSGLATVGDNRSQALVTYLQFKDGNSLPSGEDSDKLRLFDYEVNKDETKYTVGGAEITGSSPRPQTDHSVATIAGSETLRLFTDVGWSALSIYQDYAYGSAVKSSDGSSNSEYKKLIEGTNATELTQLFSNSTFVRVEDRALKITVAKQGKKLGENGNLVTEPLEGAQFKIYRETTVKDESGNDKTVREYYNTEKGVVTWQVGIENGSVLETKSVTVNGDKYAVFEIGSLGSGEYFLQEVKAPEGYMTLNPIPFTVNLDNAQSNSDVITSMGVGDNADGFVHWEKLTGGDFYDAASGSEQYLVTLTDDNAGIKVKLNKVAAGDESKPLAGAEFILYREKAGGGYEYSMGYQLGQGHINWTDNKDDAVRFITNEDGIAYKDGSDSNLIQIVVDGTYYIEEVKAPPGYNKLSTPIEVTVTSSSEKDTKYTVSYEVPDGTKGSYTVKYSGDSGENAIVIGEGSTVPEIPITVPNTSGFELPQTGSSGELIYTLFGGMLMALPIMCGYARRRRERRKAD